MSKLDCKLNTKNTEGTKFAFSALFSSSFSFPILLNYEQSCVITNACCRLPICDLRSWIFAVSLSSPEANLHCCLLLLPLRFLRSSSSKSNCFTSTQRLIEKVNASPFFFCINLFCFLNNHIFSLFFLISWFTWVSLFNNVVFSSVLYYLPLVFVFFFLV